MRNEILQLKDLGRMPNESINDTESIDELVNTYDALLEQIQLPISFDEAMVLVQIFPENAFYDLQWSLLKLVESVCVDDENKYIQLINSCPSQEWRDTLNARYANYKKAHKIFHKYYWPNEVDNYLDKLYYSGGIIPIQPLSTKTVL